VVLDTDTKRGELYGKAGSMRIKEFGVEYRTLSNFWIFDENLIKWIFNQVETAFSMVEAGFTIDETSDIAEQIITTINTSNKEKAEELIKTYNITLPSVLINV
jgi:hypothetical protein